MLTAGQASDARTLPALLDAGGVRRSGPGRPRQYPRRLVGDKGYAGRSIRALVRRRGMRVTIPYQRHERGRRPIDRAAYRQRNRVERLVNRLKQWRRIATRYEKLATHYRAMVLIAASLLWL